MENALKVIGRNEAVPVFHDHLNRFFDLGQCVLLDEKSLCTERLYAFTTACWLEAVEKNR